MELRVNHTSAALIAACISGPRRFLGILYCSKDLCLKISMRGFDTIVCR